MNWEAIGAISQMLGSMAVFVTLVYLALQVRHARQETRRALGQGRAEANRSIIAMELDECNLAPALKADRALSNDQQNPIVLELAQRAGLTSEEAYRVLLMNVAYWNYRVQVIPYVDELTPMERTLFEGAIRQRYGRPGAARFVYEGFLKRGAHPDAVRYIEDVLAAPG